MKQLTSLLLALLTLTATAQINYPFNPDENADAFISTPDLMEFLVVFGYEWEQEEIQVDSIPLSMYLSSLEAMIEASALPEGTNPGQFLQWNGEAWELVMPKVGCTLPEACNYDPTAHVLFEDVCVLQDECGVCDGVVRFTTVDVRHSRRAIATATAMCWMPWAFAGEPARQMRTATAFVTMVIPVWEKLTNAGSAMGRVPYTVVAARTFRLAIAIAMVVWMQTDDGICDDVDECVGELDAIGQCNGTCAEDADGDGICDDNGADTCFGEFDACGVCNGPGLIYECGCNDLPEGDCDCAGNPVDEFGNCPDYLVDNDGDGLYDELLDPCKGLTSWSYAGVNYGLVAIGNHCAGFKTIWPPRPIEMGTPSPTWQMPPRGTLRQLVPCVSTTTIKRMWKVLGPCTTGWSPTTTEGFALRIGTFPRNLTGPFWRITSAGRMWLVVS